MSENDLKSQPSEDDGLIFSCRLDGRGGAELIGWCEVESWSVGDPPIWIHLDHGSERVRNWLQNQSGLTTTTAEALLATETRPRMFRGQRGLVAILRGVNLNPDSTESDMIAMRMWSEGERVITIRRERLLTPRVVLASLLESRNGPKSIAELYVGLIGSLTERMSPTITALDDRLDQLESEIDLSLANQQRRRLSEIRYEAVVLRRFISPQREALNDLLGELPSWMDDRARPQLREAADRLLRYVEELDALRERAMVVKDEIANLLAEATNKTLVCPCGDLRDFPAAGVSHRPSWHQHRRHAGG